jgi:phenylacetate-CoA ligase
MLCAGEPLPQATRQRLEDIWGAEVYDHIGGTEPCAWAGMCQARKGLHIIEPFFLVEILDADTLSREVGQGELGVAVVTPLGRHSFPLIRFNTNDIVRRGTDGCPCGRTSRMVSEVVGRADDLCKIRGVLFTPVSVEELLRREFPEIGEYEIIVECKAMSDEITLKVESGKGMSRDVMAALSTGISERLKIKTNLRFNVDWVEMGQLERYTLKSKRFKDLRKTK